MAELFDDLVAVEALLREVPDGRQLQLGLAALDVIRRLRAELAEYRDCPRPRDMIGEVRRRIGLIDCARPESPAAVWQETLMALERRNALLGRARKALIQDDLSMRLTVLRDLDATLSGPEATGRRGSGLEALSNSPAPTPSEEPTDRNT